MERMASSDIWLFAVEQFLDFIEHGFYVGERAVDAGEADLGDFVQAPQVVHD